MIGKKKCRFWVFISGYYGRLGSLHDIELCAWSG
jgi:hypothetical protein